MAWHRPSFWEQLNSECARPSVLFPEYTVPAGFARTRTLFFRFFRFIASPQFQGSQSHLQQCIILDSSSRGHLGLQPRIRKQSERNKEQRLSIASKSPLGKHAQILSFDNMDYMLWPRFWQRSTGPYARGWLSLSILADSLRRRKVIIKLLRRQGMGVVISWSIHLTGPAQWVYPEYPPHTLSIVVMQILPLCALIPLVALSCIYADVLHSWTLISSWCHTTPRRWWLHPHGMYFADKINLLHSINQPQKRFNVECNRIIYLIHQYIYITDGSHVSLTRSRRPGSYMGYRRL